MKFIDILRVTSGDTDIFHSDIDSVYPSLVDINLSQFTPYALQKFEAVLQATVKQVEGTRCGLQITLSDVSDNDLHQFANAHSGNINNSEYEKLWKEDTP